MIMNASELLRLRQEVTRIVREAGAFMAAQSAHEVMTKEGHANFVTDMDVAVQERVIRGLRQAFPEAAVLAEEQEGHDEAEYLWVIDPIDGTTNFICGLRFSCISVALVHRNESILGVVYNPYSEELFEASKGHGAFLNERPIHVSERLVEKSVVGFGTSPYHTELADQTFRAARMIFEKCADIRRSGSAALDLAYVACGRLDGFFEYILSPWDYAAGACLIREAGGMISGVDEEWSVTRPIGIVTGSPALYETLHSMICQIKKAL